MRLFIKMRTRDKLINQAKDGSGFQTIKVLVTNNFELAIPEPERPYWIELYPSWEERTLHLNAFECGLLFGLIMQADEKPRRALDNVWNQLVTLKRQAEEEAGVTKEILPGGMIRIKDKDGTVIIRQPYPYEVEGN